MSQDSLSASDQKKKALPKGLEQISLQEYRTQRNKAIELRQKKIKSFKTSSKAVQIILILLAIPFVGLLLYWGFLMFSAPAPKTP